MKKISIYIFTALAVFSVGCTSYLDVNTNPDQAVTATPNLILPQALTATAGVLNAYNNYGAQVGGYAANAGGYGGFNESVTYKFTTSTYAGLWGASYDNLEDYQYIINTTTGNYANSYFNAAATIMRAYGFQLLVDTYNDVPYSKALKGSGDLTPAYDKGSDIYKALAVELDSAMARINRGLVAPAHPTPLGAADVLFKGDMTSWLKLANTIKLRLMIRGKAGNVTFDNSNFDPVGFLTTDALINPGYRRDVGRQNPMWNNWVYSYTGATATKSWMPSTWIMSFYNGANLTDYARGMACYYNFKRKSYGVYVYGDSISNQLGVESTAVPACPNGSFWYSGTDRGGTTSGNSWGIIKGPDAGMAMFTAAESYFLQAEAASSSMTVSGVTLDPAATSFSNGIKASFKYLYSLPNGNQASGTDYATDATNYVTNNTGNYVVDFSAAGGDPAKELEAIITQKYIALNFINSQEGWNEYRRTGFPRASGAGATTTFASTASQILGRTDRLPTRILYPVSESAYNPNNVPSNVTVTSLIFWAK